MEKQFWIEKAWGESVDNANLDDVKVAIKETRDMDDEHGAFWIQVDDSDHVLEVHKDLKVFFMLNDNPDEQITRKVNSWAEIERLYDLFFKGNYGQIERELKEG